VPCKEPFDKGAFRLALHRRQFNAQPHVWQAVRKLRVKWRRVREQQFVPQER
jgi:hypothetical protein